MESKKPNSFREAALSHIPMDVVSSMIKETAVSTDGLSALEAIARNGGAQLLPKKIDAASKSPTYISYAIDGHVISVPADQVGAAIAMFYTLLALVWSKDKKVAKILKQFGFEFFDSNKKQIYPPLRKKNARK